MVKGTEDPKRSLVKGISWRIVDTIITMILVLVFTGKAVLALGIGGV